MINNTLEQLKSEGARLGFLGLSLETLLERAKKSVELEYHKAKSSLLNRMNRIKTKLDNTGIELDKLSSLINKMDFTINGIVGSLFLILTGAGLIVLWDNILNFIFGFKEMGNPYPEFYLRTHLLASITHLLTFFGLIIGACSLGGFLLYNDRLDSRVKKQLFVAALSICASLITIVSTIVIDSPVTIAASITLGIFVGIIVYLINLLLVPTLDSLVDSITYLWIKPKSWLISKVQNFRKARLSKLSSRLKSIDILIHTKTEILKSEIHHEYALGKAATSLNKSTTKQTMEEKTDVWKKQYLN